GDRAEAARALISATAGVAGARRQIQRLFDRLDEEGVAVDHLAAADHLGEASQTAKNLLRVARGVAATGHASLREPPARLADALLAATTTELRPEPALAPLLDLFTRRTPSKTKQSAADEALAELIDGLGSKTKLERAWALATMLREAPALGRRERDLVALL